MGVKLWVRAILAVSVLPSAVWALGLGDIRLKSALNAPLDAEIEVVNATPEEMAGLKAALANRETFARYGLEWPSFLGSVSLSKAKDADGRDILRLRSTEAITEPFVTLLVDANWGRGRLVREYTVLLDPPVFAPTPAPAAAVQAPATAAPRSGAVERALPAPEAGSAPPMAAPETAGDSYLVQRGETLTGIAERYASRNGVSLEQAMVGIFKANRAAFDGNMDRMRAGAVLRVDPAQMAALSREAAVAEVRRQRSEWRSRAARGDAAPSAAGGDAGRLRLVPPGQSAGEGGTAGATQGAALRERVAQLEQELAEARRLIELRSAEIADLQRRLGGAPAAAPATPSTDVAVQGPVATDPVTAPESPLASAAAEPPAAAAPPVSAGRQPEAAAPMRPRFQPEPQAETSLLDGVLGALRDFWYVPVALLALLGGFYGYRRSKARAEEGDDDLTITSARPELAMPPPVAPAAAASDTARLRRPNLAAVDSEGGSFVVEEEGQPAAPAARGRSDASAAARTAPPEATLSGETALNLDQGDPLAEADFHMAYGLYDQAADLVKLAIGREPERRDLKLKLAEVYFVWGNRDEFLATVRELEQSHIRSAPGEWEKIAIMGRQIAPDDPTFAAAAPRGAGAGLPAVDLALDGAEDAALDFEVVGDDVVAGGGGGGGGTLTDLDIGRSGAPMFDVGGGTTREMAPRFAASAGGAAAAVAVEEFAPGALDIEFGDSPTVEQPHVRPDASPTIREKLDAAMSKGPGGGVDQTAELALDDLGLDLGADARGLEEADAVAHAPTAIVELDEELDAELARFAARVAPVPTDDGATVAMEGLTEIAPALPEGGPLGRSRPARPAVGNHGATLGEKVDLVRGAATANRSGDTSIVAALDLSQFERDFDLPTSEKSRGPAEARGDGADVDLHGGTATMPELSDRARAPAIAVPDEAGSAGPDLGLAPLEPVTISEVGTKLDLARAYMDMGDPDGARSILKEVLSEGSVSQKQEAQRLIESLPG